MTLTPWDASRTLLELETELEVRGAWVRRFSIGSAVDAGLRERAQQALADAKAAVHALREDVYAVVRETRGHVTTKRAP